MKRTPHPNYSGNPNVEYGALGWGWTNATKYKSRSAQMHLTTEDWDRANKIRKKLGLEPVDYPQ